MRDRKAMPSLRQSLDRLKESTMGSKGNRPDYMLIGFSSADATNIQGELDRLYAMQAALTDALSKGGAS